MRIIYRQSSQNEVICRTIQKWLKILADINGILQFQSKYLKRDEFCALVAQRNAIIEDLDI